MNAIADEAPSSPPGLTASKSSKASTNASSSSNSDGIVSDVSNFEDIGLDEELATPIPKQPQKQLNAIEIQRRANPRTLTVPVSLSTLRTNASAMSSTRDLVATAPRIPRPPLHLVPQSPFGPPGGPPRKFTRNASTPSLAIRAMSNYNRSRSPSPHNSPPMAHLSPRYKAPARKVSPPAPKMPIRRGSWQPSGKTAKQREAECDDEDGDDLPDEASLWNVPISPRPLEERQMSLSPAPSPRISPGGSPERSSPLRTSVGADGVQYTAPKSVPLPSSRQTLPANFHSASSPPPPKPIRGVSMGVLPDGRAYQRSRSWNLALAELSQEAQMLTQTLENHDTEQAARNGAKSPDLASLSRVKSEPLAQLPPLRTNNIMIDPLPISKEKERVLSRTRPSWLPPKSKSEERRHLAEYQKMMSLSQAAERKRAAQVSEDKCTKDTTKATLLRLWEEHVLPNWSEVIRDTRARELWWRGIPPKCRSQAWSRALGNDLALTETSYQKALARARSMEGSSYTQHRREKGWFEAIARDTAQAFPDLHIFQPGGPLHDSLVDVLKAYAVYRSDVGYSHGTHLLAAFLLLNMPTASATFISLANLLNRPLPLAFLTGDAAGESKAYALVLAGLRKKYPRLHDHLFGGDTHANGTPASSNPASTSSSSLITSPQNENLPPSPLPSPASSQAPLSPIPPIPSPIIAAPQPSISKPSSLHLPPHLILEPLLRTLFLSPSHLLDLDTIARLWDVFVFDGDAAIIRGCVAVLGSLEGKLYGNKEEVLRMLGWGAGTATGEDAEKFGRGKERQVKEDEDAFMIRVRGAGREMVRRARERSQQQQQVVNGNVNSGGAMR